METLAQKPLLTACLIVRNESARLERCLQSIIPHVQEIIIGDTGSDDNTPAIARKLGAKVIDVPWQNDFALARNAVMAHASGEWILIIDADEIVAPVQGLDQWLVSLSQEIGGVFVTIRSEVLRADGDFDIAVASAVRIVRNNRQFRFSGSIHEQIWQSITSAGLRLEHSPLVLLHDGYALPPEAMSEKRRRNLSLLESALEKQPHDAHLRTQLAKTLLSMGERARAKEEFLSVVEQVQGITGNVIQSLNYLAQISFAEGNIALADQYAQESLNALPQQVFARFILAEIAVAQGNFSVARELYAAMRLAQLTSNSTTTVAGDMHLPPSALAFRIGKCHAALGEWGHAYREFSEGLQHNYKDKGCLVGMTNIAVRLGNASEARRWAQKAHSYHPNIPEIRDIYNRLEYASEPVRPTVEGLTCVILAEDNDSGLQRALFSAKGISRSVLVLHYGNEPFVQMLAQQQGVEYKQVPSSFTHADMMNFAMSQSSGAWLLLLWHDEALTSEQEEYLRITLPTIPATIEALKVTIEQRPDELGIRAESVRLVRLTSKAEFIGAAHPRLKPGTATTEHSKLLIHRFALPMSFAKQQRYARLLESAALQHSDTSAEELFDLAMYLLNFGGEQVEALAVKAMQRYAVSPFRHGAKTAVLLNSFSRRLITRGDFTTLSDIAAFSVEAEPRQTEAYWYLYLAETASGDSEKLFKRFLALTTALEHKSTSAIAPEKQPELGQVVQFGLESALAFGNEEFARVAIAFALRNNAVRVVKNALLKYIGTDREGLIVILNNEFQLRMPLNIAAGNSTSSVTTQSISEQKKRPLLTLCMIVKNEEGMLEGCLQSIQNIADEIIIADTGSSDGTVALAERYNAQVISVEWTNDFAAARNAALQHCTGEWILYLDADERIAPGQRDYIMELLQTLPDHIGGVICTIRSPHRMAGEQTATPTVHSGGYPRLFRNYGYPSIMFTGRVHEQISPSLIALGKELTDSAIEIQHLGYDCDPITMEKKVRRNYELLLQHVKEEPENAYSWFQLGQTLGFMNMDSQSISTLEFAIALGTLQPHIWASAAASISQMYGRQKNFAAALEWADKSLEQSPNQLRALNLRAHALLYLQRWQEAYEAFSELAQRNSAKQSGAPRAGYDIAIPDEVIRHGLATAKKHLT